jgi:hypothetical protein
MILVPCEGRVIEEARRIADIAYGLPEPILIRSLDLLHMASASLAKASAMISADHRVRILASALGMKVLPEAQ